MSTAHSNSLQRRITAYHEAGHAVIALRMGLRLGDVALCSSGPLLGYTALLDEPIVHQLGKRGEELTTTEWLRVLRDAERHAAVLLAGPVAEGLLLRIPLPSHGSESDLHRCCRIAGLMLESRRYLAAERGLDPPTEGAALYANRLRRKVRGMLAHPGTWRSVRELANDLAGWGRLNGNDAADTVQWSRRSRDQMHLPLPVPEALMHAARPVSSLPRHQTPFGPRALEAA